jgi:hypothetical protein
MLSNGYAFLCASFEAGRAQGTSCLQMWDHYERKRPRA